MPPLSKFLNIVDVAADAPDTANPAIAYPFPLDPFQKHAIAAINRDENVLVTAKTGSGKTLVGEYQIAHSLRKGGRVFYTTPIKSLSNQKFHDLKQQFPSVGIVTGDIKFQPDAAVVIMTTECLRNLLYKQGTATENVGLTAGISLTGLDAVIFDEVHYITNKERGKVWEETLVLLPPTVNLVLLSATIDGAANFASWLGEIKQKPIYLINTEYRIVPLKHAVLTNLEGDPATALQVIMDNRDKFNEKTYDNWLRNRLQVQEEYDHHRRRVKARAAGGYEDPVVKAGVKPMSFLHELNATANWLYRRELLPAIFFVFSRKSCEDYARKLEGTFLDPSDAASVRHIINFHLHRYNDMLKHLPQYHDIVALLERGIAYHHSGLLPILKEIVELLFAKGLVKALFATETFAVGINMPTKTVVFLDYYKYDDEREGLRILATDEYIQMAGRAGRRGKDKEGLVLYMPARTAASGAEVKKMMTGARSTVTSRMDFGYDFVIKTLQGGKQSWLQIAESSLWNAQRLQGIVALERDVDALRILIGASPLKPEMIAALELGVALKDKLNKAVNAAKKDAQREYGTWQNRHMGKVWADAQKEYTFLASKKKELAYLEEQLLQAKNYDTCIAGRVAFLEAGGFLKNIGPLAELGPANLTELGILASEVNEANPILLVKAYNDGIFSQLAADDVISVLSAFIKERGNKDEFSFADLQVERSVRDTISRTRELAAELQRAEIAYGSSDPAFWELNPYWIEITGKWLGGSAAATICTEYGIYEGNLYRGLMSIANVANELISLATIKQDVVLLEKIGSVQQRILRDIAVSDSLYLRL